MGINSFPPTGGAAGFEFPSELIDPVSKFRVSNPENLIDTDFEYGLQPTKWETVELINNTPSFFSKSGDTTIDGISSIITNAGTREIIVKTELDHGLAVGIPINVTGTKSITADGSYIINSIPDTKTFTYLCKDDQAETASILDLYSSIITGEFFQGSQLRVSDSEGIITDAAGTSQLTVTTNSTHGFGSGTPFYFLNLNSTVAQEFQAANTASKTFDASNSATAQTFDGSNTLSSFNIDWSNSAVEGGTVSNITSTDTANSRITVSHTAENFANLTLGTPLYYSVSAVSGYFNTNPRGVVFLKTTTSLGTSTSTFQVSLVPDGEPILFTTALLGTIQIANQARTFAGNNLNPLTQVDIDVQVGPEFAFDGGNQGFVSSGSAGTPPDSTLTISEYSGTAITATNVNNPEYYVGSMVRYSTTGTAATGLSNPATYFIKTVTNDGSGGYTITISDLPGAASPALTISGGTGTQTLSRIGVSIDKDIVHVKDSNFAEGDMLEYTYPTNGGNGNFGADFVKKFYFVEDVYDAHNYKLSEDVGFRPVVATGGTVTQNFSEGRIYNVHTFTTVGTTNFVVTDEGKDAEIEYLIVAGGGAGGAHVGGGGGAGGLLTGLATVVTGTTYPVVVGAGGTSTGADTQGNNGANSSAFGFTAIGGGGGGSWGGAGNPAGKSGGSGGGGGGTEGSQTGAAGAGTAGQGFAGGSVGPRSGQTNTSGAGGGGASAAALSRTNAFDGGRFDGANGVSVSWLGGAWFAGGGGSGTYLAVPGGNGGRGGGGGGSSNSSTAGLGDRSSLNIAGNGVTSSGTNSFGGAGAANSGGGGGGGAGGTGASATAPGGSGIVAIRYPVTPAPDGNVLVATGGITSLQTIGGVLHAVHTFDYTGQTQTFNIIDTGDTSNVTVKVWGAAGGGGTSYFPNFGGPGGYGRADINISGMTSLSVVVGQGGGFNTVGPVTTYGHLIASIPATGLPPGFGSNSGNGGGLSGVFNGSATFANSLLIAGGGGGSGQIVDGRLFGAGGPGGGPNQVGVQGYDNPANTQTHGRGGTLSAGGQSGIAFYRHFNGVANASIAQPGGPLYGGHAHTVANWTEGGGGGAGYYGGGSGAHEVTSGYWAAAGGGSGYAHPILASSVTAFTGNYEAQSVQATSDIHWASGISIPVAGNPGGNGRVVIMYPITGIEV